MERTLHDFEATLCGAAYIANSRCGTRGSPGPRRGDPESRLQDEREHDVRVRFGYNGTTTISYEDSERFEPVIAWWR